MPEILAILDTDVAILMLDTRKKPDADTYNRRERAASAIDDVRGKGARCLITTATLVELSSWRGGPTEAALKLRQFVSGLRTCTLTIGAAETAGRILLDKLKPRPAGKSRHEIKFDALIAGIAHAVDARWLITGNAKDYKSLLDHINSPVQVIDIDAPPTMRRQLTLAEQNLKERS